MRGTVGSVARGVRFWQLARLGVGGRAWASLTGVFGGDVGRARMGCGRCECGRRSARRVTQEVGVMQHSASCGNIGQEELVGKVLAWGREAGRCRSVVCIGPVASRRAIYVFGVTPDVRAVDARLGWARGRVRLTGRLAARLCCVCPSSKCV